MSSISSNDFDENDLVTQLSKFDIDEIKYQLPCHNPILLTLPQFQSAKKKLIQSALTIHDLRYSLKAFYDSDRLNPTQFREQLKRNLLITLTDEELGAIVMYFDDNGSRNVSCKRFLTEFNTLVSEQKQLQFKRHQKLQQRIKENKTKHVNELEMKYIESTKLPNVFKEDDLKQAMQKIAKAAFEFDPSKGSCNCFGNLKFVNGIEFRELIKLNLGIKFNLRETAAIIHMFASNPSSDTERDESDEILISCQDFLKLFYRIHDSEIQRHRKVREIFKKKKQLTMKLSPTKEMKSNDYEMNMTSDDMEYSEEDYQSFRKKLLKSISLMNEYTISKIRIRLGSRFIKSISEVCDILEFSLQLKLSKGESRVAYDVFRTNENGVSYSSLVSVLIQLRKKYQEKLNIRKRNNNSSNEESKVRIQNETSIIWPQLPPVPIHKTNTTKKTIKSQTNESKIESFPILPNTITTTANQEQLISKQRKHSNSSSQSLPLNRSSCKSASSLTTMYPFNQASPDILAFIQDIEQKEHEILQTKNISKRIRSKKLLSRTSSEKDTYEDINYEEDGRTVSTWDEDGSINERPITAVKGMSSQQGRSSISRLKSTTSMEETYEGDFFNEGMDDMIEVPIFFENDMDDYGFDNQFIEEDIKDEEDMEEDIEGVLEDIPDDVDDFDDDIPEEI